MSAQATARAVPQRLIFVPPLLRPPSSPVVAKLRLNRQCRRFLRPPPQTHLLPAGVYLLPDPQHDAVECVILCCEDDSDPDGDRRFRLALVLDGAPKNPPGAPAPPHVVPGGFPVRGFESEGELLDAFAEWVRELDPDVILGYEVQQGSVGYLSDRFSRLGARAAVAPQLPLTPPQPPLLPLLRFSVS